MTKPTNQEIPKAVHRLPKRLKSLWFDTYESAGVDDSGQAIRAAWQAVRGETRREKEMNDSQEKSLSLDDWRSAVRSEFRAQFDGGYWPRHVFDDYIIVLDENEGVPSPAPMYKVTYTMVRAATEGDAETEHVESVQFAERQDWVQVVTAYVSIKALDAVEGEPRRWLAISSGGFEDREGELVSTDFLADAVERAEKDGDMGELWIHHVPGSRVGVCDFQALASGFLIESGTFDDTPRAEKAINYLDETPDAGVSIQFVYKNRTADGVYLPPGAIIERSILTPDTAAFPWSGIALKELHDMAAISQKKQAALTEILGTDETERILDGLETGAETLKDLGVRFKEIEDEPETEVEEKEVDEPESVTEPETEEKEVDENMEVEEEFVLSEVALDAIAEKVAAQIMPALTDMVTPLTGQITDLHTAVKAMGADLADLAENEEQRIAEKVADLPRATLRRVVRKTRTSAQPDGDVTEKPQRLTDVGLSSLYGQD